MKRGSAYSCYLLIICMLFIVLISTKVYAEQETISTQDYKSEQDINGAIDMFRQKFLKESGEKSPEEAKTIYSQLRCPLIMNIGPEYTWPFVTRVSFQDFLIQHGFEYIIDRNIRLLLPEEKDIQEHEVVAIAKNAILNNGLASEEELNDLYMFAEFFYHISNPQDKLWTVYYVYESPGEYYDYLIQYFVDISPQSGYVEYVFPLDAIEEE